MKTDISPSEHGRVLQAQAFRPRLPKICAVCGQPFTGTSTARFCSNACRQRAFQRRRRAERRQTTSTEEMT